jgi:hypothetical protein
MTTIDERFVAAPPELCFLLAADVERWPELLPHYRWVRFHRRDAFGTGRVEMAAFRYFTASPSELDGGTGVPPRAALRYPTWWLSEMAVAEQEPAIYFRHVDGITRGMDVKWAFERRDGGTHVRITHAWQGPPWPLIGGFAWRHVIGPRFVSFIATRTLDGIGREAERRAHGEHDTVTSPERTRA